MKYRPRVTGRPGVEHSACASLGCSTTNEILVRQMSLVLSTMFWTILLQGLTRGIQALKHLPRLAVLLLNENELKAGTMRAVANLTSLTVRPAHAPISPPS